MTNDNILETRLRNLQISNEESNKITRESIQTALIYLLNKKSLNKISIVEIVEKAGVSRSAFYNNYNSKEEILFDFAKDVLDLLSDALNNDDYTSNNYLWFRFLFTQIKSNERIFKLLFREKIDVIDYLFRKTTFSNTMDEYRFVAMKTSLIAIIEKWIDSGMKESIHEMANFCKEIYAPLL